MSFTTAVDRTVPPVIAQSWRLLTWPVWNHNHHRLRAPIRALLPLVMTFLGFALIQDTVHARFDHPVREIVELTALLVVLVGAILISAKLIDRRPVAEYGLSIDRSWLRSFAVGGVIATIVNAGTLLLALAAGWATVSGFLQGSGSLPFVPALIVVFAYVAVAASWEEFIFRGGLLKNSAEGADGYMPQWAAVALAVGCSTLVFAFLHSGKISHLSGYSYYVIAGLIFGSVYIFSGDLALPIGFHVFYNFTMTAIFGLGVSQQSAELIVLDVTGPAIWIGEEGIARILFAIIGGVLLLGYIRWRDGHLHLDEWVTEWTPRTE